MPLFVEKLIHSKMQANSYSSISINLYDELKLRCIKEIDPSYSDITKFNKYVINYIFISPTNK
jgi:hypothetical protein